MGFISGCTAYDLILVHDDDDTTARSGTSKSTGNSVVQHAPTNKVTTSTTSSITSPSTTLSISASECIFRFGTRYSSSSREDAPNEDATISVYLVVHHSTTGATLRFPISTYNTIQQQQQQPEPGLVVQPPPSNSDQTAFHNERQQHDPVALRQLMEALTSANHNNNTATNPCGPY